MFNIEQSPFLHALGYAIGHSLWQMSLLWLVYTGIIYLHHWTSSQRYNFSVATATTGLSMFVMTFFYYVNKIDVNQESSIVFATIPADEKFFTPANKLLFFYHSTMATLRSLAPYFSCAYLVVMLLLSVRLANGFSEIKKLRSTGLGKANANWRLFVKEHAALLGIKRKVQINISNIATSPLTIGFWKPFILIPLASINQLSTHQMEAVLLHELAHIRRNDYLLNIILQLAEIALFFNPFMRLLLKQARLERENCCDDYVLQFQYNATDYARALLAIEQYSAESILALGTNNNNEFQLLNRIKRMLAPERKAFNYRQQLGLLFIITILGLGFTVIAPKQQQQQKPVAANLQNRILLNDAFSFAGNKIPEAIDLIKNLQNIQEIRKNTNDLVQEKSKKIEKAAQKVAADFEANIKPHTKELEALALEFEKLNNGQAFDLAALAASAAQVKAIGNADWAKIITPIINESSKIFAYPEPGDKLKFPPVNFLPAAPPPANGLRPNRAPLVLNKEQVNELKSFQENAAKEQQRWQRMNKRSRALADSFKFVLSTTHTRVVNTARARMQAAIAPYRVRETPYSENKTALNSKFDINVFTNNTGDDDGDAEAANSYIDVSGNGNKQVMRLSHNHRDCPSSPIASVTKVTVFNGKAFSDKVKKVWAEAQPHTDYGWSDEMQQKVLHEIEKELKNLEHVEIKTSVSTSAKKSKTIVIEVQGL